MLLQLMSLLQAVTDEMMRNLHLVKLVRHLPRAHHVHGFLNPVLHQLAVR